MNIELHVDSIAIPCVNRVKSWESAAGATGAMATGTTDAETSIVRDTVLGDLLALDIAT